MAGTKDLGRDRGNYQQSIQKNLQMSGENRLEADWLQSDALRSVVTALTTDSPPRIVGGSVRDTLLNLSVADIDFATPLLPKNVIERLENAGIKAIPTGIDHGTITAVSMGQAFEITTLRRDVSTDGRRATVAFSDDWKEDAARRDFTINALYADPITGEPAYPKITCVSCVFFVFRLALAQAKLMKLQSWHVQHRQTV
jgi:Poly A polymerase head domain